MYGDVNANESSRLSVIFGRALGKFGLHLVLVQDCVCGICNVTTRHRRLRKTQKPLQAVPVHAKRSVLP